MRRTGPRVLGASERVLAYDSETGCAQSPSVPPPTHPHTHTHTPSHTNQARCRPGRPTADRPPTRTPPFPPPHGQRNRLRSGPLLVSLRNGGWERVGGWGGMGGNYVDEWVGGVGSQHLQTRLYYYIPIIKYWILRILRISDLDSCFI